MIYNLNVDNRLDSGYGLVMKVVLIANSETEAIEKAKQYYQNDKVTLVGRSDEDTPLIVATTRFTQYNAQD